MVYIVGKYRQISQAMENKTDIWIKGAGLAGLTAAWHCAQAGLKVVVTDTSSVGSGASGTWWGLLNPATGIKALPTKGFQAAVESFERMMVDLNLESVPWIRKGIVRPAIDKTLLANFKTSSRLAEWPKGWIKWMDSVHGLSGEGALLVNCGYAIDTRLWMTTIADDLRRRGVDIREDVALNHTVASRFVLHATGADILTDPMWSHLRLHPIKGQLREIDVNGIRIDHPTLSARGYAVQVDGRHWVIGSTYEHEFQDVNPDPLFDSYLIDRFKAMFPQPLDIRVMARWSGVRVGSHNRAPILEVHPVDKQHLVLTALGSKGLLYSQVFGKQVADHVLNSV